MKNGFTLVELAIVLLIVGLLLGGVLKAQEMIYNSRINKFMTDEKAITAAFNAYIDKYGSIPGDDPRGLGRFPNCIAIGFCTNGNGNGMIEELSESPLVYLVAANMLKNDHFAAPKGQMNCLASPIQNGFWNIHTPVNITLFGQSGLVWLNMIDGFDNGIFTPKEQQRIDTKMDDSNGTSGDLLGINNGRGDCTTPAGYSGSAAGSGDYNLTETIKTCRPFFRI
jgi:prepilin-type N-terminal cleavage/methylation domain-containing protein